MVSWSPALIDTASGIHSSEHSQHSDSSLSLHEYFLFTSSIHLGSVLLKNESNGNVFIKFEDFPNSGMKVDASIDAKTDKETRKIIDDMMITRGFSNVLLQKKFSFTQIQILKDFVLYSLILIANRNQYTT